jgi:hypothetical protein
MQKGLPAIFANLLQLNAYRVLKLPENEWLYAVLTVGPVLPVSFLYNQGLRLQANGNHNGR